jgi:D-amino-acid dehydrogenase
LQQFTSSGSSPSATPQRVAVIGAGIVGMSVALFLQRDGHQVTVVDRVEPGTATSFGSSGGIITSAVRPTSTPDLFKQLPAMLLDSSNAVRIRWRYLPQLTPWLVRFLLAGRISAVESSAAGLAAILAKASDAHRELVELAQVSNVVRPVGWVRVYETEEGFARSAFDRALMTRHGIKFEVLDPDGLRQLEPHLAPRYVKALFHAQSGFVRDPWRLIDGYARRFQNSGGRLVRQNVRAIEPRIGRAVRITGESDIGEFDSVIVCAGAWSGRFAAAVGDRVSLDTERGYHLTIDPGAAGPLSRPVVLPERQFVLAPMPDGVRLTSGAELAGLAAPPDFTRIARLLPAAQQALPGLSNRVSRRWMGYRPSTPDSLPIIGRSPSHGSVIYAFGHGHLGLTLGPITGRLIASLIRGQEPEIDIAPYRPNRF